LVFLELGNHLSESFNVCFPVFELAQELEGSVLGLLTLFLNFEEVVSADLKVLLVLVLVLPGFVELLLNLVLLTLPLLFCD